MPFVGGRVEMSKMLNTLGRGAKRLTLFVLLVALFPTGCDFNKEERERLARTIAAEEATLQEYESELDKISEAERKLPGLEAALADATSRMSQLERAAESISDKIDKEKERATRLKDHLTAYVLDHKLASAALLAAGGGTAGALSDNVDEDTKKALAVVAIVGGAYCIMEAPRECTDVAARVAAFSGQMKSSEETLSSLRSEAREKQEQLGPAKSRVREATRAVSNQQQEIEKMNKPSVRRRKDDQKTKLSSMRLEYTRLQSQGCGHSLGLHHYPLGRVSLENFPSQMRLDPCRTRVTN